MLMKIKPAKEWLLGAQSLKAQLHSKKGTKVKVTLAAAAEAWGRLLFIVPTTRKQRERGWLLLSSLPPLHSAQDSR